MFLKSIISAVMKRIRRSNTILGLITLCGGAAAAGLTFLGTDNLWLTVLAGLAGLVVLRIWWILERGRTTRGSNGAASGVPRELAEAVNTLSLEVADLSIHVQSPPTRE